MNRRIILCPGTFANKGDITGGWWQLDSSFCNRLRGLGFSPLSFVWSTDIDGVIGDNTGWKTAGARLAKQILPQDTLIGHSHAGQVIAYAMARVKCDKVFTLATPVRSDIPYESIRHHSEQWIHVYGDFTDWPQLLGSLFDGAVHWNRREMALADRNIKIAGNHADCHSVEVWDKYGLWSLL